MASKIRECFVPRPGWAYCSVDYGGVEMVSLAQHLYWRYGDNPLRASINAGEDTHCRLAATMVGKTYQEMLAGKKAKDPYILNLRQAAKAGNFGMAGGMGPVKFVIAKRKDKSEEFPRGLRFCELLGSQKNCGDTPYEVNWKGNKQPPFCPVCVDHAADMKQAYLATWDLHRFFRDVSEETSGPEGGWLVIPGTRVVRGPLQYTSYANGHFQGLAAVAAKRALWAVTKESYVVKDSSLYKVCRPVAFIHDEILSEIWLPNLHEAAERKVRVMIDEAQAVMPDVKVTAEPAAALRWYKGMSPVYGSDGRLQPWAPKGA